MLKGSESKTKGPSKWQTSVSQKKKMANFFCDSWGDPHNDFSSFVTREEIHTMISLSLSVAELKGVQLIWQKKGITFVGKRMSNFC